MPLGLTVKAIGNRWLLLLSLFVTAAHAEEILKVSRAAWNGLSDSERARIQASHVVDIRELNSYGSIVDTQGVNESTPGSAAGTALGSSIAEAAYIDHALKQGNNYSAKNQLAASILGAVIGSSFNTPGVQQFHFRYAIKIEGGDIQMVDSVQSSPFRHPVGLCVSIPEIQQLPQSVCSQTAADLRRLYLGAISATAPTQAQVSEPQSPLNVESSPTAPVQCRLGNLAPVSTSVEKCKSIGGVSP
jgi:hypothetical protein